jgi:hypothetical protein
MRVLIILGMSSTTIVGFSLLIKVELFSQQLYSHILKYFSKLMFNLMKNKNKSVGLCFEV